MPDINFTIILFFSFPEAMVIAWLSLSLLGFRPKFSQILQIGALQTLFVVFLFLVVGKLIAVPFGVHTLLQAASFSLILHRVMEISYKRSCLAVLLGLSVYLFLEGLTAPLFAVVTGYFTGIINKSNWWLHMPSFIIKIMVTILIILLIRRCNCRLMESWDTTWGNRVLWVAGLLFSQSVLICNFSWRYYLQYKELFPPIYFYLYFIVANIILPAITVVVIRQFAALMKSEVEAKTQLDTLRHVEELLYTMRIQRHDFSHEMQVVYGLLDVQAFPEARDYLHKSVAEVAATSELVKTDNLGVTALLYTKTGLAEARKIDLQIRVETSLQQFPLAARDINLILGNLIDNALDAVEQLPVPERKVEVCIGQGVEGYVLAVKNAGPPMPPDTVAQLFAPGFSTKGAGRGMGLYSIQKLMQKHRGDIRVTSDDGGTVFHVRIPAGR